jgi:hypothetical protein
LPGGLAGNRLTWGTGGTWSARFWGRSAPFTYQRIDAACVRVVGRVGLAMSFHPLLRPEPPVRPSQQATISVWGSRAQADLARARVGIIGLGSVGASSPRRSPGSELPMSC